MNSFLIGREAGEVKERAVNICVIENMVFKKRNLRDRMLYIYIKIMAHVSLYLILQHAIKVYERVKILLQALLISTLGAGKQLDSRTGRFNPTEMATATLNRRLSAP
jgi:hypothetical protein